MWLVLCEVWPRHSALRYQWCGTQPYVHCLRILAKGSSIKSSPKTDNNAPSLACQPCTVTVASLCWLEPWGWAQSVPLWAGLATGRTRPHLCRNSPVTTQLCLSVTENSMTTTRLTKARYWHEHFMCFESRSSHTDQGRSPAFWGPPPTGSSCAPRL